ncbi:MAG: calcium-binding protein [Cyanobacteria bacterium P01_H01_bin.58]
MASTAQEPEREQRIANEIVVDAYSSEEVAMGWYYYLENTLQFPFAAIWIGSEGKDGDAVEVLGMAEEEECTQEILVEVGFEGDAFTVPLLKIAAPAASAKIREAIADWHYWIDQGYGFT